MSKNRKSIRLKGFDYSQPSRYYVTICTQNKENIFGNIQNGKTMLNKYGKIAEKEWLNTKIIRPNVDLDYFIIMPNHLHGIIIIKEYGRGVLRYAPTNIPTNEFRSPSESLGAIIRGYKSTVTKQINELRNTPGLKLWQRNYYEHIIRNEKDLYRIRRYIVQNPLKWEFEKGYRGNMDI